MCMKRAGAVTVTAGDRGAMIVMFAPIGPVVEKVHAIGAMKFSVVKELAVNVTVVDIGAISVSVVAAFAVMVRVTTFGRFRNKAVADVVTVKTLSFAASTLTVEAVFVIVRAVVAFGA